MLTRGEKKLYAVYKPICSTDAVPGESHKPHRSKKKKYIDTLSYKPLLTTNRSLRNQRIQFGRLPARPHYSSIDGRPEQTVLQVRQ
jgi:hypothetical protein